MPQIPDDGDQSLLDRSIWAEPLFKFAQVSRLVISLYDRQGKRWCGPCFSQSLAARLARAGIWDEGGWGLEHERRLVQICVEQKEAIHESVLGLFGQLALPCLHKGEVALVFVLGWVPQHGADAATLKDLADALDIPLEEMWQLIRNIPPVSADRLRTHGHMLELFSAHLVQQLSLHKEKDRELTGWKILSDTAFALAGAVNERDICQIAHRALRGLLQHAHAVIKLIPTEGQLGNAVHHENEDRSFVSMIPRLTSVRRHFSIPILVRREQLLGQIDITVEYGQNIDVYRETLSILAGQIGVALHKTRAFKLWEQERGALERRLAAHSCQHRLKDEFLAAVSHELKMPLHAIMGWAQRMQEEGQDPSQYREAMRAIERSARHQSRLIEDLLDISQMISGAMHLEYEVLDAAGLLEKTLESVRPMLQLRQQKIVKLIPVQSLRLRGDGSRLQQVFWNLLSNASKFTADGGQIQMILEEAGPHLRFEVRDSGKGIAAADITRLFYCFQSDRTAGSQLPGGLGLGLAIVKHLVDLHGGNVRAESEGEGCGATFTVLLPRISAKDTHPQRLRGR